MGKQQGDVNFTPQSLGLGASKLAADPTVQTVQQQSANIHKNDLSRPDTDNLVLGKTVSGSAEESNKLLPNGEDTSGNIEHQLADAQPILFGDPGSSQVGRAILGFAPMVATDFVRGIMNLAGGLGKIAGALGSDTFGAAGNRILDPNNAANKYIDEVSSQLMQPLATYSSDKYDNGTQILTSKFWTDDVALQGGAFLASMGVESKGLELGTAGATGAVSKGATSIAEALDGIPMAQRIATSTAKNFSTATVGFLNAAMISGMQAKGTADQIDAKLRDKYSQEVNPDTGALYTPDEIDQQMKTHQGMIDQKKDNTFWATMATELLPSIYASKLLLGTGTAEMGEMNSAIVKGVNSGKTTLAELTNATGDAAMEKAGLLKNFKNTVGKEVAHAAFIGGPVAMNLQGAIQKYDVDQATAGNNGGVWDSKFGYLSQFLDNFTDKEGIKSMVVGSVLGSAMGAFHAYGSMEGYNEAMKAHIASLGASDRIYQEAQHEIHKTDINGRLVLNENGEPIPDVDKMSKLLFQTLHTKNLYDNQTAAILAGNSDLATMNDHVTISQAIAQTMMGGSESTADAKSFFKWFHSQRIKEQAMADAQKAQSDQAAQSAASQSSDPLSGDAAAIQTKTAMSTGSAQGDTALSKAVNDNKMLVDKMFDAWDKSSKQAAKLSKIGDDDNRTAFNDNVQKSLYYEAIKREGLMQMIADRQEQIKDPANNIPQLTEEATILGKLHQDSLDASQHLMTNTEEVYKGWNDFNQTRLGLLKDVQDAGVASKSNADPEVKEKLDRTANMAEYKAQEFSEKKGIANGKTADGKMNPNFPGMGGVGTDPNTGDIALNKQGVGTNQFIANQSIPDRVATPLGTKNEFQFKAGQDYRKMVTLNSMIDKLQSGDESVSLKDVINYANDNITHIDDDTRNKLQGLTEQAKTKLGQDEEKLASIPEMTDDGNFNPEYQKLDSDIEQQKQGLADASGVLRKNGEMTELDRLNRQPDKIDEHLNKAFAEKQLDQGRNVIDSATDSDGSIKGSYVDSNAVQRAITKATNMRNALTDRMDHGDLKGNNSYQYLVDKADSLLEQLKAIQDAVVDNKANRDGMQARINLQEAHNNTMGFGYSFNDKAVVNTELYNMADAILDGNLAAMLEQVHGLTSNQYEGTMAILYTLKTNGSPEDIKNLVNSISENIQSTVNSLPSIDQPSLLIHFGDAPELYFASMFQALHEPGYEEAMNLDSKNGPLNQFRRTNDIDQLVSTVQSMPEDTKDLGAPKDKILQFLNSYKEIIGSNRVKNLLNSKFELNNTVKAEIERAKSSNGILPTTQQEVSIRDGLAWLADREPTGTRKLDGWAFLRGIAGTGKTNVVVKWIMDLSGIKPDEILTTAITSKAADVIANSTGTTSNMVEDVLNNPGLLEGKKALVLDEYARLTGEQIAALEKTIREHNKTKEPGDRVKTLILGDPTQITPNQFRNSDITSPTGANPVGAGAIHRIRTLNPLTVVYRSDISAVNETSDKFQDNPDQVQVLNLRANTDSSTPHAVGSHTGKSAQDILDVIKANQDYEKVGGYTPRTRAIIVDSSDKAVKYQATGAPVITVYDAQSETYDEVYVDIDKSGPLRDDERFNTAMYTAASRAKEYSFIKYPNGSNNIDAGLTREKTNNDASLAAAQGEYIKTRAQESAMMEAGVGGKPIDIPKAEMKVAVAQAETPLQKATDINTPEDAEIVNETPSAPAEQNLPIEPDPEGYIDPETGDTNYVTPIHYDTVQVGEHVLPNIDSAAFPALKTDKGTGEQAINTGSPVTYLYAKEKNGQNAITVFGHDKEGNWIPLSKIFQGDMDHAPEGSIIHGLAKKAASMKPAYTSDPTQLNSSGNTAGETPETMKAHVVQQGTVSRYQRMTYQFDNKPVEGKGVLQHIKDIFKGKFFHSSSAEQAKADKVHYRIFRDADYNAKSGTKFGSFKPDRGIPYAIVGVDPNTNDYRGAQFIRLTASHLNQNSEHYTALKAYRDLSEEVRQATGVEHGSNAHNIMMRAIKDGLEITKQKGEDGNTSKVTAKQNYSREEFAAELQRIATEKGVNMPDSLTELAHPDNQQFDNILPKIQEMGTMYFGPKEKNASLTAKELLENHGPEYMHVPFDNKQAKTRTETDSEGKEVQSPLGHGVLKGTENIPGTLPTKARTVEITAGEGIAQKAFDQLAKANEFVGGTRIRVPENDKPGARKITYKGKSLITDEGGNSAIGKAIGVLGRIHGENQVAEGTLKDSDLKEDDVKRQNEAEVRQMAKEGNHDTDSLHAKLMENSKIAPDRQAELRNQLDEATSSKETPPITNATLDLMVGNENYENGEHLTAQEYNVQNPTTGKTKTVQTYLRQPLDIDQFNKLGKDLEANSDALGGMVGTKFKDVLPTQIAVNLGEESSRATQEDTTKAAPTSSVPGSKQEIQSRIDELMEKSNSLTGKDKRDNTKAIMALIKERDGTRAFDQQQRPDAGQKITVSQARDIVKQMLPNASPEELQFLNRTMMFKLQNPGENLLGLFKDGQVLLREDDGSVHANVVRHEIFHSIFNDYLSQRERNSIAKAFDPQGKMAPTDLEESLADKFMAWQAKPEDFSSKVKRIFTKILNWMGFAKANSGQIDQLFKQIEDGKFQVKTNEDGNARMAFNDIRKFGTIQDYKNASAYLQNLIHDTFISDNINNMPVTARETYSAVKDQLQDRFNEANRLADNLASEQADIHAEMLVETDPDAHTELAEELEGANQGMIEYNQNIDMLNNFLNKKDTLDNMWNAIYPSFKFNKSGTVDFTENSVHEDPESLEHDEASQDKDGKGLTDFTIQSDERNNETKVTDNVKNFLSFLYRNKGRADEAPTRINPRGVYLHALRNLSGLSSSDGDFIEQVQKRAEDNGINIQGKTDAARIVQHILNLYRQATGDFYRFTDGTTNDRGQNNTLKVQLDPSRRFLDDNTFIMHTDGKDVKGLTSSSLPAEVVKVLRNGRSTSDFLNEISETTGMNEAKGYFKQHQAQETLREVMSNFLSQREATPMIAEEKRGFSTVLTYFRAQNHGIERVKTDELENSFRDNFSKVTPADWKAFDTATSDNTGKAVADILKKIGVKGTDALHTMSDTLVSQAKLDIQGFREIVRQAEKSVGKTAVSDDASDSDEGNGPINHAAVALENNTGMVDRLTRLLTLNSSDARASSYQDVSGTKRYLFHNGSQAHDTLAKIMDFFNQNDRKARVGNLPEHFKDAVMAKNIFGLNKMNRIYEVLDHDGQRQEDKEEFATTYSNESNMQWLKRNFSDAFLTFAKTNTSNTDGKLTYMQNFYTISNRPRMTGARINILNDGEVHSALVKGIEQHVEQPDTKLFKNYDRFKAVNFDEMHKAIEALHVKELGGRTIEQHRLSKDVADRAKLGRIYDNIRNNEDLKNQVADHMMSQLKELSTEAMSRMKQENVTLGSDVSAAMALLKDPRKAVLGAENPIVQGEINTRKDGWPSDEVMQPTVENFYKNNYVNSYFLNQAIAGNMNYFKDYEDMTKRMSGIFAPGTKGMIGDDFFMKQKFNVAVAADPKLVKSQLSSIFNDTKLQATLKKSGIDLADAQGFMLPERAENLVQGFGNNYNAGAVFKPAHYEVTGRTLEDGTKTYTPVMLKYSSVVLSDELTDRFPKLAALRDEMRSANAHEFVFDSGTKVGAPVEQVNMPGVEDYSNNNFRIDPRSIIELSNENYRLQLNPNHEAYDSVSNPTQLSYFMNVMHKLVGGEFSAQADADKIFSAIGEKVTRGINKLSGRSYTDTDGKFSIKAIKDRLSGKGDERLQEMLGSGISYNFPNIADKAIIQMANIVSGQTVQVKFPGGKMVLQSSYGADIPPATEGHDKFWSKYGQDEREKLGGQARRLEYKEDPATGRWHAEVIMPMAYKTKAAIGDFMLPDGMGFRIPSTELHSSLPLKVAGFYDDKGSNVVVAPAELVAQHGSDFDVDSLYVITRELASRQVMHSDGRQLIDKNTPVGYYPNADDKLEFNADRFRAELDKAKIDYADDRKATNQLEKLHDQMLNNQVTESFLNTISHPEMKDRMLTPISTDVLDEAFDKLGIEKNAKLNGSRLLDNLQMYNSNFQGAALVGIFANGAKALSYMSRAGASETGDAYPQLQKVDPDTKESMLAIHMGDQTYDKFTELDKADGNLWEQLDALINTSVDNVKDQKLALMNATDRTGPAYIMAKALGMPLQDTMSLMLQPVIKLYSNIDGGRSTVMANLETAMVAHANTFPDLEGVKNYQELKTALENYGGHEILTAKSLKDRIGSTDLGQSAGELAHQVQVLEQFRNIQKMGDDLTTFSRAISIVQDMPVFYYDIASKVDQWKSLGTVTDGQIKTNPEFSFNIDNLFSRQPNIAEAYKAFTWMKSTIDKSIIKQLPEVQALADNLSKFTRIRLVGDKFKNTEMVKNEIMSYLVSNYYAKDLKDQEPVTIGRKKGNDITLTGRAAWSHEFGNELARFKDEDSKLPLDEQNPFMKRLSVKPDKYGINNINFANASNPTPEESVEMQEGFSSIKDEQMKQDLTKYAALNYGMSFGLRNYSMFIPSEYLKPISDFITGDIKTKIQSSTVDENGEVVAGPLRNMMENLAIKMSINNVDKLPYLSKKKGFEPIQAKDERGELRYTDDGAKVLQGYNGEYFWHRAYENPVNEFGDKRKYSDSDLPPMIWQRDGNQRDVGYIRVNPVDSDEVYYQRAGYRNFRGGYEASDEAINGLYKSEEYFGKGTIPVPVGDVHTEEYETRSEHIVAGSRVIVYPYSNETREQGVVGIVDKVRPGMTDPAKIKFTLRQQEVAATSPETQHVMDIANNVATKFGLTAEEANTLPEGTKGMYKDGIISLTKDATAETAFHEVSHPLVAAIKKQNPVWYSKLQDELKTSSEGKSILNQVQAKYPELSKDGQEVEALVTAIGKEAAKALPESNFRGLIRRLMRSVGSLMKSVISEIRMKGGISLDSLANEDMSKLTIGDIASLLSAKEFKPNLDLSGIDTEGTQFSKDLDEEEPKVYSSVIASILDKAKNIQDPEVDENGQQGDNYIKDGNPLVRVSRWMDNFTFRTKAETIGPDGKPMTTVDAIAKRDADRMYKNVPPGGKLIIDGIEMGKDEYQAQKAKIQLMAQVKGDIIHAKIQQFFTSDPAKLQELQTKIDELSSKTDVKGTAYDWITEPKVFRKLMENAGINISSKNPDGSDRPVNMRDKIYSEVTVGSDLLGAGKIDNLVERPDGRLRITDWKTGSRLRDKYTANIMKYGIQENRITDNPLDRAALQVMGYALIIKAEHPEAKFDGMTIMHIPNEHEATQPRNAIGVHVPDYLRMIEQYYRNEQPAIYKKLLEQSPKIFDPREYNAPVNSDFAQDVMNSKGASEAETLQQTRLNLQKLITSVELRKQEDSGDDWTRDERRLRDNMMKKILQASSLVPVDFTGELDSKFEVSTMTRYLANLNDTHNPYIQSYSSMLNSGRRAAETEFDQKKLEFRRLESKVLEERVGKRNALQKALTWVDKRKLYANLIHEEITTDPESGTTFRKRGLTHEGSKDEQGNKTVWDKLSPAEKNLSVYMRTEMKNVFDHVMTSGPEADLGNINGKRTTKLDLYNSGDGGQKGANFEYTPDFMPRVAITEQEAKQIALDQGIVKGAGMYIKDQFLRKLTDYFQTNVEGYNQRDYGLPVRFLGNGNSYISPDTHSSDLELAFNKYMEQMINKKHLDSSWIAGTALKGYLDTRKDMNGNLAFKNTAAFLDFHMKNILIGDRIERNQFLTRHGVVFGHKDGSEYTLNLAQLYRSMKSGVAAGTLWLQPVSAAKNALQASYMLSKESLVGTIGKNFLGISPAQTDLTSKAHYSSYAEAIGAQGAAMAGKANSNFIHTLAKELRLYPEMSEASGKDEDLMTKGCTMLNTKTFGYAYQIPEEVTATMYALNSLKNMEISTGAYKGRSMYDMYKDSFQVNEAGDGSFKLPEDFSRGKIQLQDGTFEKLAGLHPMEMQKIQRGIQKLRGGYKPDEKTAIQATILGDAMMMFKRWIPSMLVNQFKSKYSDPSSGQFELSDIGNNLEQKPGEDIYAWRARVVEGRVVTVAKLISAMSGFNKNSGYNWADLSGDQKKSIVDLGLSLATLVGMLGISQQILGDKKDENSLKQFTTAMTGRFLESWWTPTLASDAIQPPAVVKKTLDMFTGFENLMTAGYYSATGGPDSKIHTNTGHLKGVNEIMKNTPLLSSYYNVDNFVNNDK